MGRSSGRSREIGASEEVSWGATEITRTTGRRYSIKLEALDDESLRELQRLVRDLDHEKQMAVQQARLQPWRR